MYFICTYRAHWLGCDLIRLIFSTCWSLSIVNDLIWWQIQRIVFNLYYQSASSLLSTHFSQWNKTVCLFWVVLFLSAVSVLQITGMCICPPWNLSLSYTHTHTRHTQYSHSYIYTCIHLLTLTNMHAANIHTHTHTHTRTQTHTHKHTRKHTHTLYVYIYIIMHTHT